MSENLGIGLSASGDTDNTLTAAGLSLSRNLDRASFTMCGEYQILRNKCLAMVRAELDDTAVKITYDSKVKDPVVTLTQQLNDIDTVAPSLSLKTGKMAYKWNRQYDTGDVESTYYPGDKVEVRWSDNSYSGTWTTQATIPLDKPSNCKLSFSRNINF